MPKRKHTAEEIINKLLGNVPNREESVPQVKPVAIRPRPRRRVNRKLQQRLPLKPPNSPAET